MVAVANSEWLNAQKIQFSVDLVSAAKQQLSFLTAVDRNPSLYEGPLLGKAIYRYTTFWLPLLAKHCNHEISENRLIVPLDSEWIWHCHRLNPVQYRSDCMELYGRILDGFNVISSVQPVEECENAWNRLYPDEPFEFERSETPYTSNGILNYDLIGAVRRQAPFFYQVSRPHMLNDLYLGGAVERYKGFLHLIKRNGEKGFKCFCVPTYDIDLIWHSHQLHPSSYCEDMSRILGRVLEHDDMDSDRTEGKKLDVGFKETRFHWVETFGLTYMRAGAMHRKTVASPFGASEKKTHVTGIGFIEVLLEIVGVENLSAGNGDVVYLNYSKKPADRIFKGKRRLPVSFENGCNPTDTFICEPTGELLFELLGVGSAAVPMHELSKLFAEKWLELEDDDDDARIKKSATTPTRIRVALSSTTAATVAPRELLRIVSPVSRLLPAVRNALTRGAHAISCGGNGGCGSGCGGGCGGGCGSNQFKRNPRRA